MTREISEDERADYRQQKWERIQEAHARRRCHPFDPTCGCDVCSPEREPEIKYAITATDES